MATLRAARIGDAAEIARLAGELGYPVSAQVMEARLAVLLPQPQHRVTVAEGEGGLLGWIAVGRQFTLDTGDLVEILGLVVDAHARRSGIGHLLVADAESWAQAQGFDAITVRSNVARGESHPFYERLGYARRKSQHVYRKPLDASV